MLQILISFVLMFAAYNDLKNKTIPVIVYFSIISITLINYLALGLDYIITSLTLGSMLILFFLLLPNKHLKNFRGGDVKLLICMAFFYGGITWFYWISLTFLIAIIHKWIIQQEYIEFGVDMYFSFVILMAFL